MDQLPEEVAAVFVGDITAFSVQRIAHAMTTSVQSGVKKIHLLFQTTGGFVGDGMFLYNFFRTLPAELSIYNVGAVQSIGTLAFLGAHRRYVSKGGSFLLHKGHMSPQAVGVDQLAAIRDTLDAENARTELVYREHLRLSDEEWTKAASFDLIYVGHDAVTAGFADEVRDFVIPQGVPLFSLCPV